MRWHILNTEDLTIAEIKELVKRQLADNSIDKTLLKALGADERLGVQRIYQTLLEKQKKKFAEQRRLQSLFQYESRLSGMGKKHIAGVDEAGRGPLAGPVVAAAVILPLGLQIYGLNDSKKIPSRKREEMAEAIKDYAVAWSIGQASVEEIEQLNIYHASLLAMSRAVQGLSILPDHILVDAFEIPQLNISQTAITGGDCISASIAAASIIAKTYRDQLMREYHLQYPQYGFDKHKGYPTAEHIRALKKCGPASIHRRNYGPVANLLQKKIF